jgi:uncharacterized protein (DUF1697 family)
MQTYVSILRGINVSGQKKILMSDLKDLYANLNYKNIQTYIQSGNVVFSYENTEKLDKEALKLLISKQIGDEITQKYNFHVSVIIRTAEEIANCLTKNPFLTDSNILLDKLHVSFLSEIPKKLYVDTLQELNFEADSYKIIDKEVYLYCPNGYGNTKLSNNFFENKLKVIATTRNWKTINELLKISKNHQNN